MKINYTEKCWMCDGTGIKYVFEKTNGRVPRTIPCPECEGTGTTKETVLRDVAVFLLTMLMLFVALTALNGIDYGIEWDLTPITIGER